VDIWAVGLIMYEIISLKHPLWENNMEKEAYRDKVKNLKKIKFGHRFNRWSRSLIQSLCHAKPSCRYTIDQALSHPWITRDFQSEIPRTHFEKSMFLEETDNKLRKVF